MMQHRKTGLLLAVLLISLQSATACAGDETLSNVTESGTAQNTEPAVTEERWLDNLPDDLDLGGAAVVIRSRGDSGTMLEIDTEGENGDVLNDAIYQRNQAVEERLNVDIVLSPGEGWASYSTEITTLRGSISAGDNAWQIIAGWANQLPALSLENCFYDLSDMEYLDLKQPWWNQSAVEGMRLCDKLFFVTGDVAFLTVLGSSFVVYVNDRIASELDLENVPQLVRDDKWTLEKMGQLTAQAMRDLDGNGVMDEKDCWGIVLNKGNNPDAFYTSSDIHQIIVTDGIPSFVPDVDRLSRLMDQLSPFYFTGESVGCYVSEDGDLQIAMFGNGQALMTMREMACARSEYRTMEDNYTIVPYPKLDDTQEEYYSACFNSATIWGIPSDNPDPTTASIVMEALAAESYNKITPTFFETCMQEKFARNEDTIEMLNLIRANGYIDAEYLYMSAFNYSVQMMRDLVGSQKNEVASYIAKREKQYNKAIEKMIEQLENLET